MTEKSNKKRKEFDDGDCDVDGARLHNNATKFIHALNLFFSSLTLCVYPLPTTILVDYFASFCRLPRVNMRIGIVVVSWFVCDICPQFSCSTNMCLVLICVYAMRFSIGCVPLFFCRLFGVSSIRIQCYSVESYDMNSGAKYIYISVDINDIKVKPVNESYKCEKERERESELK